MKRTRLVTCPVISRGSTSIHRRVPITGQIRIMRRNGVACGRRVRDIKFDRNQSRYNKRYPVSTRTTHVTVAAGEEIGLGVIPATGHVRSYRVRGQLLKGLLDNLLYCPSTQV